MTNLRAFRTPNRAWFLFLLILVSLLITTSDARPTHHFIHSARRFLLGNLVPAPPLILRYFMGPLITGPGPAKVYLLWYGNFTEHTRKPIEDLINSLRPENARSEGTPSVSSWWKTTGGYRDAFGSNVTGSLLVAAHVSHQSYMLGKQLRVADIEKLVHHAFRSKAFPIDPHAIYLVLTASDVYVDGFCMHSCGFHSYTFPSAATDDKMLPFAWVGNAASQCPGMCAWPFATPMFGPQTPPLLPPNGDVGIDGMIINIATVLAGCATNPFDTGYYEGDAAAPLEAVSSCTGIFGKGAYPGYTGELRIDNKTGASYNVDGIHKRKFLLPAMWNPSTLSCQTP